jgi:hypothetical protein
MASCSSLRCRWILEELLASIESGRPSSTVACHGHSDYKVHLVDRW